MMKSFPLGSRTDSQSADSSLEWFFIAGPILTPLYTILLGVQGLSTQEVIWGGGISTPASTGNLPLCGGS